MISISSLIYKSTVFADSVYESLMENTPLLHTGEAEFYFIANDATDLVKDHLQKKGYKHYINENPRRTEAELFSMGIGWPEYIHRVYRGWNQAIFHAQGDIVVLVNSDNLFSPNWLENLLKHVNEKTIVCSQLIERKHPKYAIFPGAYHGEFGTHPREFRKEEFLNFCKVVSKNSIRFGGAYMPCAFVKDVVIEAGLYPEGNLCGRSFNDIVRYGDEDLFYRLDKIGVKHITALDSLSYHFKEGEMDE